MLRGPDSEAEGVIAGRRVEVKLSMLWRSGVYKFQQIRDQSNEFVVCPGVLPFDAHAWVTSKDVPPKHVIGHTPQHAGRCDPDTFWVTVKPGTPPEWLRKFAERLAEAFEIMRTWQARR